MGRLGNAGATGTDVGSSCPALWPGIHVLLFRPGEDVDGRDRPGHDGRAGRDYAFSRHNMSELSLSFRPRNHQRAQGRPGAHRTHGSRATKARGRTTGTGGSSGLPCAMALRLIRALPGDRALLPPSSADRSAHLAPALERQNHTISPSAAMSLVVSTPPRPPHPTPRSVTIASRPSYGCETSESIVLICPTTQCRGCATQWHDGQIMLVRYALGVMPPLVICRRVTAGTAGAPRLCCRLASKPAIWYR